MTTATVETVTHKTVQAANILERCVCLLLTCGYVGNYRKMDAGALKMEKDGTELEGEKKAMTVTKRLVESSELSACAHVIGAAKNYLGSMSSARGHRVFGPGTYLIPFAAVEEVEARLAQFEADLLKQKTALAVDWPNVIERSRIRLGRVFNAAEMPTAEEVLSDYELDWSYVAFGSPERLEDVNQAVAARSREKWEAKLQSAHDEVVSQLREAALRVMQELADRLRPGEDGKPKALRPTALRDLNELLQRMPILNITEDTALVDTLAPIGAFAEGISVDALKTAPAVRAMLLAKAEEAASGLGELVSSGRRAITFGKVV